MNMPANSVWLRDLNRTIPNDNGLYIVTGLTSARTLSNTVEMKLIDSVESQVSTVQQLETIQIDIISNSINAMTRSHEVIMAMQSFYSQQVQEKYNFKIFRIPMLFTDTSAAEGGGILKRYTISIYCLVWYRKVKAMVTTLGDYYDDFTQRVDDEASIGTPNGIIEFEINSGGIVP